MRRLRFILGDVFASIAQRFYPDDVAPPELSIGNPHPFFTLDEAFADLTDGEWAGLMVLHAEAVHSCDHTEMARAGIGMAGPRGKAIAS